MCVPENSSRPVSMPIGRAQQAVISTFETDLSVSKVLS